MAPSIKFLGILVGILVMLSGLQVHQAAASNFTFELSYEQTKTTIRGGPTGGGTTISITGQTVTCEIEEFHGTVAGSSSEYITLKPAYTGCTAFGFAGAKVTGFGHYGFTVEGTTEYCYYTADANGTIDLVCPKGRDVTIEIGSTCIAHLPAQTGLGRAEFSTGIKNQRHDLYLELLLTGITVTHTDLNFLCPFSGSGEVSNATIIGTATIWGQDPESGEATSVTWDI